MLLPENVPPAAEVSSSSDEEETTIRARPISQGRAISPTRLHPQAKPPWAIPRKSFAERLAKSQRDESMLPRVTGYCTCEAYKLLATQKFLMEQHGVKSAVIYDEALYARYELPLRNGEGGFRVRSGELKRDDSSREYNSDSEMQVKKKHTNGEVDEEGAVGSSAMLDGQGSDEVLLFSPPKSTEASPRKVFFLNEEDQGPRQSRQGEPLERPSLRRESTGYDVNALSNLAEGTSFPLLF